MHNLAPETDAQLLVILLVCCPALGTMSPNQQWKAADQFSPSLLTTLRITLNISLLQRLHQRVCVSDNKGALNMFLIVLDLKQFGIFWDVWT